MLNKHFGETNLHLAIILVSFYIKMKISDYYILTFAALSFIILAGAWLTDNQFRNDIFLLLFVPEKIFLKLCFDFHHVSVESFGCASFIFVAALFFAGRNSTQFNEYFI